MNGLVGYESSDEDEQPLDRIVPIQQAYPAGEQLKNGNATAASPTSVSKSTVASAGGISTSQTMIGPNRPDVESNNTDDDLDTMLDQMSERDKIHYLTQTTTPVLQIPPSPPGTPSGEASAKFKRFAELKAKGLHFNADLASKTNFKNPSLTLSLMDRAGIARDEQYITSLPKSVWDPSIFPPNAFKEKLLESQQSIRDHEAARKKMLSATGKRTIDFLSADRSEQSSTTTTPLSQKR